MNRLQVCPLQAGYTVQYGNDTISQRLEGGASRFERAVIGTSHMAALNFALSEGGYQYLMAFFRVWQRNPSQPFIAALIIDDHQMADYQCWFMPDSISLTAKNGAVFYVSAMVEVKAMAADAEFDQAIIDGYDLINPLEKLANIQLADALENAE